MQTPGSEAIDNVRAGRDVHADVPVGRFNGAIAHDAAQGDHAHIAALLVDGELAHGRFKVGVATFRPDVLLARDVPRLDIALRRDYGQRAGYIIDMNASCAVDDIYNTVLRRLHAFDVHIAFVLFDTNGALDLLDTRRAVVREDFDGNGARAGNV
jgi:hypothetical protein